MAESSDKYGEAAEAAFEKWWQSWRAANGYPNTERMRDAARAVYESLAYSSTDSAFETLFKQGHIEPERIPSAAALSDEQLSQAVKFRDASPNMSDSFAIAAAAPRSHAGDSRLREELLRLRQWFEDRPDRPGHKAQVIYINGVLEIADSARSATGPILPWTPKEARRLLDFQHAHCTDDHEEAYHQIYWLVTDRAADPFHPWAEVEEAATKHVADRGGVQK